jgi:signal transduction histidine kinase
LLDKDQRLQAVQGDAPDISAVVSAMHEGLGRPWTDFIVPKGMSHLQPMHWRLLDGSAVEIEGSIRDWRANLVPRLGQAGEPNGFELLLVSDQPPPEVRRNRRASDTGGATSGARMVGKEVAPALRQPISRIIANAESIRTRLAGPLADDYANYASEIAAAGQHLLGLLDDLTDLEVVESPDFSTAPDLIDLADVARQAAGILGVRAKDKDIRLVLPNGGDSLEATAEFRRVLQVLLNLLGNAINYSPAGSEVWVRLENEGTKARMIVADQGPGLSEEDAARVFEKFERLGRSGDGGSGLGLYISRRLARAMGGELSVESAPGQGARFILDLPAA